MKSFPSPRTKNIVEKNSSFYSSPLPSSTSYYNNENINDNYSNTSTTSTSLSSSLFSSPNSKYNNNNNNYYSTASSNTGGPHFHHETIDLSKLNMIDIAEKLSKLYEENNDLKSRHQFLIASKLESEKRCSELTDKLFEARSTLQETRTTLSKLQEVTEALKLNKSEKEKSLYLQLEELSKKYEELKSQKSSTLLLTNHPNLSYNEDFERLTTKNRLLEKKNEDYEQTYRDLDKKLMTLNQKYMMTQVELDKLNEEMRIKDTRYKLLIDRNQHLEATNSMLQARVTSLEEQISEYTAATVSSASLNTIPINPSIPTSISPTLSSPSSHLSNDPKEVEIQHRLEKIEKILSTPGTSTVSSDSFTSATPFTLLEAKLDERLNNIEKYIKNSEENNLRDKEINKKLEEEFNSLIQNNNNKSEDSALSEKINHLESIIKELVEQQSHHLSQLSHLSLANSSTPTAVSSYSTINNKKNLLTSSFSFPDPLTSNLSSLNSSFMVLPLDSPKAPSIINQEDTGEKLNEINIEDIEKLEREKRERLRKEEAEREEEEARLRREKRRKEAEEEELRDKERRERIRREEEEEEERRRERRRKEAQEEELREREKRERIRREEEEEAERRRQKEEAQRLEAQKLEGESKKNANSNLSGSESELSEKERRKSKREEREKRKLEKLNSKSKLNSDSESGYRSGSASENKKNITEDSQIEEESKGLKGMKSRLKSSSSLNTDDSDGASSSKENSKQKSKVTIDSESIRIKEEKESLKKNTKANAEGSFSTPNESDENRTEESTMKASTLKATINGLIMKHNELKKEISTFENEFKKEHNRPPTKEECKKLKKSLYVEFQKLSIDIKRKIKILETMKS